MTRPTSSLPRRSWSPSSSSSSQDHHHHHHQDPMIEDLKPKDTTIGTLIARFRQASPASRSSRRKNSGNESSDFWWTEKSSTDSNTRSSRGTHSEKKRIDELIQRDIRRISLTLSTGSEESTSSSHELKSDKEEEEDISPYFSLDEDEEEEDWVLEQAWVSPRNQSKHKKAGLRKMKHQMPVQHYRSSYGSPEEDGTSTIDSSSSPRGFDSDIEEEKRLEENVQLDLEALTAHVQSTSSAIQKKLDQAMDAILTETDHDRVKPTQEGGLSYSSSWNDVSPREPMDESSVTLPGSATMIAEALDVSFREMQQRYREMVQSETEEHDEHEHETTLAVMNEEQGQTTLSPKDEFDTILHRMETQRQLAQTPNRNIKHSSSSSISSEEIDSQDDAGDSESIPRVWELKQLQHQAKRKMIDIERQLASFSSSNDLDLAPKEPNTSTLEPGSSETISQAAESIAQTLDLSIMALRHNLGLDKKEQAQARVRREKDQLAKARAAQKKHSRDARDAQERAEIAAAKKRVMREAFTGDVNELMNLLSHDDDDTEVTDDITEHSEAVLSEEEGEGLSLPTRRRRSFWNMNDPARYPTLSSSQHAIPPLDRFDHLVQQQRQQQGVPTYNHSNTLPAFTPPSPNYHDTHADPWLSFREHPPRHHQTFHPSQECPRQQTLNIAPSAPYMMPKPNTSPILRPLTTTKMMMPFPQLRHHRPLHENGNPPTRKSMQDQMDSYRQLREQRTNWLRQWGSVDVATMPRTTLLSQVQA